MKKAKRILVVLSMLISAACFFSGMKEIKVHAKEGTPSAPVTYAAAGYDDVPGEIKDSVEKGGKLVAYLVIVLGGIAVIIGLVMEAIAWWGHQPEAKLTGLIAIGVGLILCVAPAIVNWLMPFNLF